jgi:hypothetical protein
MTDEQWLSVVQETVRDLDSISFTGSSRQAQVALREAGLARGREFVLAALKVRAGEVPRRCPGALVSDVLRWERREADLVDELADVRRRLEAHR